MAGNFWGCGCALSSSEFGWKPQANHICITKKGPRNKNKLIEYWLVHFNSYWIWLHFLLKCQAWDSDNIRGFCPSSTTHSSWVTLRKSVNPLSSNVKPGSWILSFKTSQWNVLEGSLRTRLGTKAPGVNKPGFWFFFTFAPWPWTSSLTSQNLSCPMVKWRGGSYLIGPSRESNKIWWIRHLAQGRAHSKFSLRTYIRRASLAPVLPQAVVRQEERWMRPASALK